MVEAELLFAPKKLETQQPRRLPVLTIEGSFVNEDSQRALEVMATLPPAVLPETYLKARDALEQCTKIDECKDWADKAQALASYAKQAGDRTLHQMADRIKSRAIQRQGELLQEIEPGRTGPKPHNSVGVDVPKSGRFAAAKEAGLSRDQTLTAVRVANVPKGQFEDLVESDDPPPVAELARIGTKVMPKPVVDIGNLAAEAASGLICAINNLERYALNSDLDLAVSGLSSRERARFIQAVDDAGAWLYRLRERLAA